MSPQADNRTPFEREIDAASDLGNILAVVMPNQHLFRRGCRDCGSPDKFPGVPRCGICEASFQDGQQFGRNNP